MVDSLQLHPSTYSIHSDEPRTATHRQSPGRARLAPRLPQRVRDLDRAPGAQHERLGRHQRPLIQNEEIRSAVGNYLVDQLYANVNVEKELEGILPGELKQLAGPASGGLRQVAGSGAEEVLKTSTAQELWKDANRAAHEQLLAVLENKKEAVSTANGEVTLNLGGLVTNLAQQVGIGAQLAEKLPPDAGQVTILRSDQLKTAQDIASPSRAWRWCSRC